MRGYLSGALRLFSIATVAAGLLTASGLLAQTGEQTMNFVYAYSCFAYDDSTSLVEFHYQYAEQGLRYEKGDNGVMMGQLYLRLRLLGPLGVEVYSSEWITTNPRPGVADETNALVGMKMMAIRPGTYRAQILYRDLATGGASDSALFTMNVRSFRADPVNVSDVEVIARADATTDTSDRFYKNGFRVIPNVSGVIVSPFLVLDSYVELYGVDRVPTSEYDIVYTIRNATGAVVGQQEVRKSRSSASAIVDMHSTTVDELPSGDYFYYVKLFNGYLNSATDSVVVMRPFTVRNPEVDFTLAQQKSVPLLMQTNVTDPIYAGLTEDELDVEYSKVKPIATDQEQRIWKELEGAEAKARFLTTFWLKRDLTINTVENEAREQYYKRVEKARALYSSMMKPNGWESDPGRVMLQYGEPDGIERHQFEFNKKPYQVWAYSNLGYQFVFVDRTETGNYVLVHSTAPGEQRYENWERDFATLHKDTQFQGTGNYDQ